MRLLVTGGAGFIGSNFVHYWAHKYPNDEIVVLDKLTYAGHIENLAGVKDKPNFKLVVGDICDGRIVEQVMKGIDIVVHFAAESHVDRSILGPAIFTMTNVVGTQTLLDQAVKGGIKLFHHVSTDEVFGSLPIDRPDLKFNEESSHRPRSPYAASKASSDIYVKAYHETYGLPITITNTSNNYGPFQYPEKLIPRFFTNILSEQKIPLMGRGENVRDWCYVEDHCHAIDMVVHAALQDEKIIGETFCVGGNCEKTNYEVTREILKILGEDESWIENVPHRLGHDARYAVDSSKIKRMLGWKPMYNFEEGLKATAKWYQENYFWWRPLKEGRKNVDPEVQRRLINKER